MRNIKIENEPVTPYPQANDLDKIIDLVSYIGNEEKSKFEIAEYFEFDERQGDYYANAGCYIGFLERNNDGYLLTPLGHNVLKTQSASETTLLVIR